MAEKKKKQSKEKKKTSKTKEKTLKQKKTIAKTKATKSKGKKSKNELLGDMGIIIVDDDLSVDKQKEIEERKAYLEEARSQDAFD